MTTTRERKENKAARLAEWAAKRQAKATALWNSHSELRHDWQFITQPGIARTSVWKQIQRNDAKAYENYTTAKTMNSRAAGIEDQLDRSIYDDDPDAIERLQERIATLEAKQERCKAANVAYRAEHKAELKTMTAYQRNEAVPYASYQLTNLGADIRRNKERLAKLQREQVAGETPRYLYSVKRANPCRDCGTMIEVGKPARWYRQAGEIACYPECSVEST